MGAKKERAEAMKEARKSVAIAEKQQLPNIPRKMRLVVHDSRNGVQKRFCVALTAGC